MSTTKQRDWLDYAGLASQLYQNIQVNDVRDKMAAMGQIALVKEAREQEAQNARRQVEHAREALFKFSRLFEKVKKHAEVEFVPSLLFLIKLKRILRRGGLDTTRFPDFEDKERIAALLDGLDEFIETSRAQLTDEDRAAVDTCDRFRLEMRQLDELIASKAREEAKAKQKERAARELEAKRQRFEEVKDAEPVAAGMVANLCGFAGGLVFVVMFLMSVSAPPSADDDSTQLVLMGVAGIFVLCAVVGKVIENSDEAQARSARYDERTRLAAALESASDRPPDGDEYSVEIDEDIEVPREEVPGIDQSLNSAELEALRQKRLEFILETTGEDEANWDLPPIGAPKR